VLAAVHKLLAEDPRIIPRPLRVRFSGFGEYSLNIEVLTYVATTDAEQYAAIREELFLKIMDIVARNGTSFAFPSQTIYAGQDSGWVPPPSPGTRPTPQG